MGTRYSATCNQCSFDFTVNEGGGFVFHELHCDKCGKVIGHFRAGLWRVWQKL